MRFLARTTVRWTIRLFSGMALLLGLYLAVFFVPYPLFPHHMEAAGFSVYSDHEFPESFGTVLKEARSRVEAMPLYRAGKLPRIFVCQKQQRFEFLNTLAGKRHTGQGLLVSAAGNAFFSAQGIEAVARRSHARPANSRLDGSWPAAIAHEVAHHLVFAEIGYRGVRGLPMWKSEGYADYSAHLADAGPDVVGEINHRMKLVQDDRRWQGPTGAIDHRHFRWQVMVEYLCEIKGMDLTGVLDKEVTEAHTWAEMRTWQRQALASLSQ